MVKIDIDREKNFAMDTTKKMEKIQIYPSKQQQQQHNSFNSKIKPKLIMSPLTTMPTKKLMIATNGISMSKPQHQPLTASENIASNNNKKEDIQPKETTILKENTTNTVNVMPMSDKQQMDQDKSIGTDITERVKETAAGYRSEREKISLGDVHPYITCYLCKGYLIEATTIVECLHTYCHSCLMKHLSREKCCPQCDMSINKSKTNIK